MPPKIIVCPRCKERFSFLIDDTIISNSDTFPIPCVVQHKEHFVIFYLDSHGSICDVEAAVFFQSE